jgi:DNA-binding response OmpR family regulator
MPINVLYVDDDDSMRSFIELACRDPDFIVTTASTGQDALILAHKSSFDLILLDVVMPGLDGPSTLELLRAQEDNRSTLIAFLTAHTQRVEIDRLQSCDVVAVLAKPFNPRTLAERLRSLVKAKQFYHVPLTSAWPE